MSDADERRADFVASARHAGMEWDFFTGLQQTEAPLVYDDELATGRFGRSLTRGELGCYASHFALWGRFLESSFEQLVVFEDDVVVDWTSIRQLCQEDLSVHGIHILRLCTTHPIRSQVVRYKLLSDHSHLVRLRGHTFGTQAYVLSRIGAQALYASCSKASMPIDWAMSRYWDYGVTNYALFPFPVFERHGKSTIGHGGRVRSRTTLIRHTQRLSWRLRERTARALADLHDRKSPFGMPLDEGQAFFPKLGIGD